MTDTVNETPGDAEVAKVLLAVRLLMSQDDGSPTPEQALWQAVIEQQFNDATWIRDSVTDKATDHLDHRRRDGASALIWLRGNTENFEKVCDLAGVNPGAIRRFAKECFGDLINELYPGSGDHTGAKT